MAKASKIKPKSPAKTPAKPAAKPAKASPKAAAKPKAPVKAPAAKPVAAKASVARAAAKPAPKAPAKAAPAKVVKEVKPTKPAKAAPAPAPAAIPEPEVIVAPVATGDAAGAIPGLNGAGGENRPRPRGMSAMGKARKPKPKKIELVMPKFDSVYKSSNKRAPLIASGPKNGGSGLFGTTAKPGEKPKPVFNKRELDKYRQILLRKRAELVGDVQSMETEALNQSSGGLSHVPQHVAEQGSDTFDQDNSLRLAQKDRDLIREIDDALKRVDDGTYGICELTGKPISIERLTELPWTRYSIEAARMRERQRMIPGGVIA